MTRERIVQSTIIQDGLREGDASKEPRLSVLNKVKFISMVTESYSQRCTSSFEASFLFQMSKCNKADKVLCVIAVTFKIKQSQNVHSDS